MKRTILTAILGGALASLAAEEMPKPTQANVAYGPHAQNVLDFWPARGQGTRPWLVHIHGGGWTGGDKSMDPAMLNEWLSKGVSVASVTYRFAPDSPLPAPVHDAARALQFLRWKAADWNLDKERVCLIGTSAGACTAIWLLCHDDLADPDSPDMVLRESTRVAGAAVARGQTSIDPKQIEPWLGPKVLQHRMIPMAVGELTIGEALKNYPRHRSLYIEFSPINHVTADDPPLWMSYSADLAVPARNPSHGIHHGLFGVKMKEKADASGMECHLMLGKAPDQATAKFAGPTEFLESILLEDRGGPGSE